MSTFVSFWNPSTKLPFSICSTLLLSIPHSSSKVFWCLLYTYSGLLQWLSSRESACNAGAMGDRFDPWVRKIPWRRTWQPTSGFLSRESHGLGTWQATVHGVAKNQTWLKQLSIHTYTYFTLNINTYSLSSLHMISILATSMLVVSHSRPRIKKQGLWGLCFTNRLEA